jgi:glutathionyl-hydroquinone reductase
MTAAAGRYATGIDAFAYGEHPLRTVRAAHGFRGRLGGDAHPAEPGRYHLYGGWFCPRSHRVAIVRALRNLHGAVSASYVDPLRDGRGWAFRERTGPDPVNGFTLLREAYLATDPAYDGPVTIPVLWDRVTSSVVSNDPDAIDIDLATADFGTGADPLLYQPEHRRDIDALGGDADALSRYVTRAVYRPQDRDEVARRLRRVDRQLAHRPFLLGDELTLADVRLWVVLVRYDAGPNATGAAGPPLTEFDELWDWAKAMYRWPAFRDTTDFAAFTAPFTRLPDWHEPTRRPSPPLR